MKFLLKLFSTEIIWKVILERESFTPESEVEARMVWPNVFHRVPELKAFLQRREIGLLKSSTLADKPNEFILGQIAENRLWQRFDVPMDATPKVETPVEAKLPKTRDEFLKRWLKKDEKETVKS